MRQINNTKLGGVSAPTIKEPKGSKNQNSTEKIIDNITQNKFFLELANDIVNGEKDIYQAVQEFNNIIQDQFFLEKIENIAYENQNPHQAAQKFNKYPDEQNSSTNNLYKNKPNAYFSAIDIKPAVNSRPRDNIKSMCKVICWLMFFKASFGIFPVTFAELQKSTQNTLKNYSNNNTSDILNIDELVEPQYYKYLINSLTNAPKQQG